MNDVLDKCRRFTGLLDTPLFIMQLMRSERYHFKGDEDRAKILADEMTDIATATKVVMFDHKPKTMRGNARRIKNVMENSGIDWKRLN